ncbi:YbjN domain-containing protein [bacterium]|nr:YbjN domain-containing protein [bacterium]
MRPTLLAVPVALLAAAPPAAAQDNLVTKVGPLELRRIALRFDRDTRDVSANQNGNLYELKSPNGRDTALLTVEGKSQETLRIYTRVKGETTLRKVNTWNRDKIHGRAYLDADDGIVFEATLWLRGGVSSLNIREWIDLHFGQLQAFKDFIRE